MHKYSPQQTAVINNILLCIPNKRTKVFNIIHLYIGTSDVDSMHDTGQP